jgi:hypothetical protein
MTHIYMIATVTEKRNIACFVTGKNESNSWMSEWMGERSTAEWESENIVRKCENCIFAS